MGGRGSRSSSAKVASTSNRAYIDGKPANPERIKQLRDDASQITFTLQRAQFNPVRGFKNLLGNGDERPLGMSKSEWTSVRSEFKTRLANLEKTYTRDEVETFFVRNWNKERDY